MDQIEIVNKLMAKIDDTLWMPYTGPDASGQPMARSLAIINGHRVDIYVVQGATEKKLRIELDKSTKNLTVAEAITILVTPYGS